MKKNLIALIFIVSLLVVFCGCKSDSNDVTVPATDPSVTSNEENKPVNKDDIDWETPIDIDDSFVEDSTTPVETDADETEPVETDASGETKPQTTDPTEPSADPTEPTDPSNTDASTKAPVEPTEPIPTKAPGSSTGPIELPMIPG